MSHRDGDFRNPEIYAMNADGSDQTRLTSNNATDSGPTFSPDGALIAFASYRDGSGGIYTMNPDGSDERRLTRSGAGGTDPDWQRMPGSAPAPPLPGLRSGACANGGAARPALRR